MLEIVLALLHILPTSPFLAFFNAEPIQQYLGYINFFIPFDICYNIVSSWVGVLATLYLFKFCTGSLAFKNTHLANLFSILF